MDGSASSAGDQSVQVPSKIDGEIVPSVGDSWQSRFRVVREIGEGGCGRVLLAQDLVSGAQVALKHPVEGADRFRREIQEQKGAEHPHVMPILDFDEVGFGWFTMPVASMSLSKAAPELLDTETLAVVAHVAKGLRHAHELGIVHRDIKPSNVLLLDGGRWVVADFGLVRRPRGATTEVRTRSGGLLGTEGFIAPEVLADPHNATSIADVYSLGRTVAWMVSGSEPRGIAPLLPEGPWLGMISRMTELDVRDRLPDMDAVIGELAAVRKLLCAEKRRRWGSRPIGIVLTDVEAAVLVAILAGASEDETGRLAGGFWNITRSDPDLTEAGVRFGLKQLADRGIIEATSLDTQDGPVAAWTPTSTGWSWLKANQADLPLWKRPRSDSAPPPGGPDDDIPF